MPNTVDSMLVNLVKEKIASYSSLLLAFSGGVDSTVLLHVLMRLRHQQPDLSLRAVHINHGLSAYAEQWAAHCRDQCHAWQIAFEQRNVVLEHRDCNIEAAARSARYQAIMTVIAPSELLLTAQHQDDQCETFFLALKRGSGPAGLSGMAAESQLCANRFCRPLLTVSRQQIEDHARAHQLCWIEDESNHNQRFDRNFLRSTVLPSLTSRWPHFSRMVARSATLCAEQEHLLDELLDGTLAQLLDEHGSLATLPLTLMSEQKRMALLRRWFRLHKKNMPSRAQLTTIFHDVIAAKEDANPQYRFNDAQLRRYHSRLYLLPHFINLSAKRLPWTINAPLKLPDGLGWLSVHQTGTMIRPPQEHETVTVRFQASGKIAVVGRVGHRSIKKLWQEYGIPPWQRQRTPLIFYNEILIAAIGIFVTIAGKPITECLVIAQVAATEAAALFYDA